MQNAIQTAQKTEQQATNALQLFIQMAEYIENNLFIIVQIVDASGQKVNCNNKQMSDLFDRIITIKQLKSNIQKNEGHYRELQKLYLLDDNRSNDLHEELFNDLTLKQLLKFSTKNYISLVLLITVLPPVPDNIMNWLNKNENNDANLLFTLLKSLKKHTETSLINELNNRFPDAYAIISTPIIADFQRREEIIEEIEDYCMKCDGDGCDNCDHMGGIKSTKITSTSTHKIEKPNGDMMVMVFQTNPSLHGLHNTYFKGRFVNNSKWDFTLNYTKYICTSHDKCKNPTLLQFIGP